MADEQRLKSAKIEVQLDTEAAERQAEEARKRLKDGERKEGEGRDKDKERRDEKREKKKEKRFAFIPGRGAATKAIRTFIQIELVKQFSGFAGGGLQQVAEEYPILKGTVGTIGERLEDISGVIQEFQGRLVALFGTIGDAGSFARSQKLLTGKVNVKAVGRVAANRAAVRQIQADIQSRQTVIGRVATGAVGVELGKQGGKLLFDAMSDLAAKSLGLNK